MAASPTAIGKLELSKTGTHLNLVTQADLEGAESEGDSVQAVSIGTALAQVKLALDTVDDDVYVQRPRPAMVDGHVAAPELTDDPWNVLPGPWNGGKGKRGYGARRRRDQGAKEGAASPTQPLPMKRLAHRASAIEDEREAVVATIANRASWHGMDEHGNVASWVQSTAPRGSEATSPYQRTLSRKDQVSEDWRQHLASAKALAIEKRRANLKQIKSYQQQVDKRPVGSHVTQQLELLMQQENEEKQRVRAVSPVDKIRSTCSRRCVMAVTCHGINRLAFNAPFSQAQKAAASAAGDDEERSNGDDLEYGTGSVEAGQVKNAGTMLSASSVSASAEASDVSQPAGTELKQEKERQPRRQRNRKNASSSRPPRSLNRTFGSSAYSALEPSQEIVGLSRGKVQRKIRMEEQRMARVQTEEKKLRQRKQRQEKVAIRRRHHEKEKREQDWGSTLSLPDIRANPRADPALCYGARSVPAIR
jgi:hypothetical protein